MASGMVVVMQEATFQKGKFVVACKCNQLVLYFPNRQLLRTTGIYSTRHYISILLDLLLTSGCGPLQAWHIRVSGLLLLHFVKYQTVSKVFKTQGKEVSHIKRTILQVASPRYIFELVVA